MATSEDLIYAAVEDDELIVRNGHFETLQTFTLDMAPGDEPALVAGERLAREGFEVFGAWYQDLGGFWTAPLTPEAAAA